MINIKESPCCTSCNTIVQRPGRFIFVCRRDLTYKNVSCRTTHTFINTKIIRRSCKHRCIISIYDINDHILGRCCISPTRRCLNTKYNGFLNIRQRFIIIPSTIIRDSSCTAINKKTSRNLCTINRNKFITNCLSRSNIPYRSPHIPQNCKSIILS